MIYLYKNYLGFHNIMYIKHAVFQASLALGTKRNTLLSWPLSPKEFTYSANERVAPDQDDNGQLVKTFRRNASSNSHIPATTTYFLLVQKSK